jgi:hypothetical protein
VDDVSITVSNVQPGTVQISNNLWQAHFILSGPVYRNAKGRSLLITNAPPGQYILEFADVRYYQAPPTQTNTLASGGTIAFNGNYTFTDANSNGIPDAWELEHFGVVDPHRTRFTDTDHDGMSDWAEFIAGTDPNNPPPPFHITARLLSNGLVQLAWPSVTNDSYRVYGSTDGTAWSPYSAWLPSAGTNTTFTLPAPTNGAPNLFRVEAVAPGGPSALAPFLSVTARLLPNGQVRLEWPSSVDHGYRVLGSADAVDWSPVSDWMRATTANTGFTLPAPTHGAPNLFRVEVKP